MEPVKVYVVMRSTSEGVASVYGVYSTEDKANAELEQRKHSEVLSYWVEEYELDE